MTAKKVPAKKKTPAKKKPASKKKPTSSKKSFISKAPVRRLMAAEGARLVSDDAVLLMIQKLEEHAIETTKKALAIVKDDRRKRLTAKTSRGPPNRPIASQRLLFSFFFVLLWAFHLWTPNGTQNFKAEGALFGVMRIEPYSPEHYPLVYDLWEKGGLSLGASDTPEAVRRCHDLHPDLFLVGWEGDTLVAVVMGAFDGRRGYVHHLAVHPAYRRRGLATAIMEELHARFRALHVEKVHLFVERANSGVIAFYEKLGWAVRQDLQMMSYYPH
jgi:ribosomal protein S18 acetylase RimI-like enzyme/histone H3/H4